MPDEGADLRRVWARDSIAELRSLVADFGYDVRPLSLADRGEALAVHTGGHYFFTAVAFCSEGPGRVVFSTGLLRGIPSTQEREALMAANAFGLTRAQGRIALTPTGVDGELVASLHVTMAPAILTRVPPFAQSFLSAFAAEARMARRFLRQRWVTGERYAYGSPDDLMPILGSLDDETDLMLDDLELERGEE